MKRPLKILFLASLVFAVSSCLVPRESRLLKKDTAEWRESKEVLSAYADTPLSGLFITLRENGKFEQSSSGLLKSFYAGSWTLNNDTLELNYEGKGEAYSDPRKFFYDRNKSTLQELDTEQPFFKYRVMAGEI